MNAVVEFKPRVNLSMQQKVEQYRNLRSEIAEKQEMLEDLKKELKNYLQENKEIRNQFGNIVARLIKRSKSVFDKEKFESENKNLIEVYSNLVKQYTTHDFTYQIQVK